MSAFEDRPKRDKQLLIRLTADEKRLLEEVAAQRDITAAELVRRAIRVQLRPQLKKRRKRRKLDRKGLDSSS